MNGNGNEPQEELQLIKRAKRGDVKAFSQLYAGIYTELYKFALYTIRHRQDAEDAVSETVMTAWEKMKDLRRDESFRNWMFTILNNQCRKILREQRKVSGMEDQTEKRENSQME
ncbi:MAG TPA: RNA polymerase sigma factor, partial [Candidatus Mediterraneibacter faecipullorum]|nr:RNA polymerase sigma factor [Candidatus Mediterraneibacter faecipullorum]